MIHEEKWYTCDRCGERIENLVEDVLDCLPEEVSAQIPRDDYLKIMSGESDISIVNAEFDGKDTETVTKIINISNNIKPISMIEKGRLIVQFVEMYLCINMKNTQRFLQIGRTDCHVVCLVCR